MEKPPIDHKAQIVFEERKKIFWWLDTKFIFLPFNREGKQHFLIRHSEEEKKKIQVHLIPSDPK